MVVLTEEFHGLSLKRKGADEPELFDAGGDGRSGFPLAWRATKIRRLACPDGPHRRDEPAAVDSGAVTTTPMAGQGDVPMGDDAAPAPSLPGDDEKAVVVYGDAGRRGRDDDERSAPRLALRAHTDWVRAMLWEADSRTARELLAGAREQGSDDDLALAVVPWVPPSAAEVMTEPTTAEEATTDGGDDSEGAAAMDVEGGDEEEQSRPWTGQTYGAASAAAEGFVYRWPRHCMAPPQMPAVAPASPVMWSW